MQTITYAAVSQRNSLEHVRAISGWNMIDFIEVSGGDYENPLSEIGNGFELRCLDRLYKGLRTCLVPFVVGPNKHDCSRRTRLRGNFCHPRMLHRFLVLTIGCVLMNHVEFEQVATRKALEVARSSSSSPPLIILTGSLRVRKVMASSIRDRHTQLIGIGRPSDIHPAFARALQNPSQGDEDVQPPKEPDVYDMHVSRLIGSGLATLWSCWVMAQMAKRRVRTMPWFSLVQMSFGVQPLDGWKVLLGTCVTMVLSCWYLFI